MRGISTAREGLRGRSGLHARRVVLVHLHAHMQRPLITHRHHGTVQSTRRGELAGAHIHLQHRTIGGALHGEALQIHARLLQRGLGGSHLAARHLQIGLP